jgi:hypothetical protein
MFQCLFFFCFLAPTPPAPAIPDGQGGYVPFTNARVMPDGSLRPYDPAIDGVMGPDGRVYFPAPPPVPQPQGRVTVGPPMVAPAPPPPRAHEDDPAWDMRPNASYAAKPRPPAGGGCYGQDGRPIEPNPPDCQTQGAPPLSSGPGAWPRP